MSETNETLVEDQVVEEDVNESDLLRQKAQRQAQETAVKIQKKSDVEKDLKVSSLEDVSRLSKKVPENRIAHIPIEGEEPIILELRHLAPADVGMYLGNAFAKESIAKEFSTGADVPTETMIEMLSDYDFKRGICTCIRASIVDPKGVTIEMVEAFDDSILIQLFTLASIEEVWADDTAAGFPAMDNAHGGG